MVSARLVVRVLAGLLLGVVLVVGGTAYEVWVTARADTRGPADAILVLGSAQYDGVPSSIFEARLDHALDLYQQGLAPRLVTVGGGQPGDRFTEAEAGRMWLVDNGVPAEDVIAVGEGSDTLQSMRAVATVYAEQGWSRILVVTDPPHVLRSVRMAEDSAMSAVASPTRQGPAVISRQTQLRYTVRETGAYLYYRLTGSSPETGVGTSVG